MTRVVDVTREELLERREQILQRYGVSLTDMKWRAKRFELSGDEWNAWDDLQEISFLLDEDE